jgi:hypothetical protein
MKKKTNDPSVTHLVPIDYSTVGATHHSSDETFVVSKQGITSHPWVKVAMILQCTSKRRMSRKARS